MKNNVGTSRAASPKSSATLTVRDARTGKLVVVRGVGALAGSDFKLKKDVSLLKPIAEQALARVDRSEVD